MIWPCSASMSIQLKPGMVATVLQRAEPGSLDVSAPSHSSLPGSSTHVSHMPIPASFALSALRR